MATAAKIPNEHGEGRVDYTEFQKLLSERRREILGYAQSERSQLDEQVMTSPGDVADLSVIDTGADYFLRLAEGHRRELIEIRDAEERMRRGVYGICQNCENPIGAERLRKLPYARLCVDCQSTFEAKNKVARPQEFPKL